MIPKRTEDPRPLRREGAIGARIRTLGRRLDRRVLRPAAEVVLILIGFMFEFLVELPFRVAFHLVRLVNRR